MGTKKLLGDLGKGRLSLYWSQVSNPAGTYPNFHNMKQLRTLLLPPWMGYPVQGYPQVFHQASLTVCLHPFILLGGGRHHEGMFFLGTQHNDLASSWAQSYQPGVQWTNHQATTSPPWGALVMWLVKIHHLITHCYSYQYQFCMCTSEQDGSMTISLRPFDIVSLLLCCSCSGLFWEAKSLLLLSCLESADFISCVLYKKRQQDSGFQNIIPIIAWVTFWVSHTTCHLCTYII